MSITVYSHEGCTPCKTAKKYIKSKGIDPKEKHITEKLKENGGPQALEVPLICNGEECITGFKPEEIDELLEGKNAGDG